MKTIYIVAFFIGGLLIFCQFLDLIHADSLIQRLLENETFYSSNKSSMLNSAFLTNSNHNTDKISDSNTNSKHTVLQPEDSKKPLKLSREELGRHSWALLHSIAASYPSIPNESEVKSLNNFIHSFSEVYACKICSKHFKEMLVRKPVRAKSREELVYYLCDLHNEVNRRLGKAVYDCRKAFDIWGGDCGCEVKEE